MIRPRKWFWSKKKLFTGEQCLQACNLFEDKIAMSATYSKSKVWTWRHEISNEKFTWIHKWLHRCWWRMFETFFVDDKFEIRVTSHVSNIKIQYNIPRARHQHHTLGFCDVGDWLECHQHVENTFWSPTSKNGHRQ